MHLPTRIPKLSSEVLEFFFNQTPSDLGTGARDITEKQAPQTQGLNALALSKYIIALGSTNPYYNNAVFFKEQWDSSNCYICGLRINDTGHTMELEHVLPIAEALALTGIIQDPQKTFTKPKNLQEVADTPYGKYYLLEYARSHRCCNQIKSATSFLSFDLNAPKDTEKYTPNLVGINRVLNDIWGQGTGIATKNPKWQEPNACANEFFRKKIKDIPKNTFIETRREFIVEKYINPIILSINDVISKEGFNFAQLVFLANQAMTVDQQIWKTLDGKKMNEVTVDEILTALYTNTLSLNYKSTMAQASDVLKDILTKNPKLKQKSLDYLGTNLKQQGYSVREASRTVDMSKLVSFLNIDYNLFSKIYFDYIKTKKENYTDLSSDNFGLYGFQYMYYLLKNQDSSIKFTKDQIKDFIPMMLNVNKFMILYIYIYIIFYNPFSQLKQENKTKTVKTFTDYSKISFNSDKSEIKQFNLELQTQQGMGQIQENFCGNIFYNLNYVIEKLNYTNIRELENYGLFLAISADDFVVAQYMVGFVDELIGEYNKTLDRINANPDVTPASGGIKLYKKLYKKTKKNNSTKRKTKTRKNNSRKNKKSKSKRNLRYTKKY